MPDAGDPALRVRFHLGDREAFLRLAAPCMDLLFQRCLFLTGRREDADDAVQEVIFKALRNHRQYDPDRPFRPWLLAIASNHCRDRRKSVWAQRVSSQDPEERAWNQTPAHREDDEDGRNAAVRQALTRLPTAYKEALTLFYLEERSYSEMQELTGASISALKMRVQRGARMLKETLDRWGEGDLQAA